MEGIDIEKVRERKGSRGSNSNFMLNVQQ